MRFALCLWTVTCISGIGHSKIIDRVVAVVNDDVVTLSELEDGMKVQLAATDAIANPNEKKRQIATIMSRGLDEIIGKRLIRQEAAKRKIKIEPDAVDQHLARVQAAQRWTDDQMNMYLAAQGLTRDDFKREVGFQMLEQRVIGMVLGQKVRINERDLKDYYQETLTDRAQEFEVDAAHIVFRVTTGASPAEESKARAAAVAILGKAKQGDDFGTLARENSQAPGAENGGDLGTLTRGNLHESLENAIFSMEAGEVDGPFRSPFGYHIVKVRDRRALPAKSYEAVKESLRTELRREKIKEEVNGWVKELRAKSFVDIRL